jgi:hypothetical protein
LNIAEAAIESVGMSNHLNVCSQTKTVSLPQSLKEQLLNLPVNTMRIPMCRSNISSTTIAASSISSALFANQDFEGDPASLQLSSFPCDHAENCSVILTLVRNKKRDTSLLHNVSNDLEQTLLTFSCLEGEFGSQETICPDGQHVSVTCNGFKQTITGYCPARRLEPSCSIFTGLIMGGGCKAIAHDEDTVTCECSLLPTYSAADERRHLLSQIFSNSSASIPSGEISVNYVSMLEVVSDTFVATVISAGSLNTNTIEKGWQSLVVVGTLAATMILLMCMGHYMDFLAKHEVKDLKKVNMPGNQQLSNQNRLSSKFQLMRNSSMSIMPSVLPTASTNKKHPQTNTSVSYSFLQIAEEALPQVLSSRSFFVKYKDELKRHHRWAGVFFHFTKKFPRALRLLSLATNIITMLFVQSITYNLSSGDDGFCERLQTEDSCLEPTSSFSAGSSKCYWVVESLDTGYQEGSCKFIQPDNSLNVIVFVAIISAVVSTPIAFSLDWVIQHILAAPTLAVNITRIMLVSPKQELPLTTSAIVPTALPDASIHARRGRRRADVLLLEDRYIDVKKAQQEFQVVCERLKLYRSTLSEVHEFDGKFTISTIYNELNINLHNLQRHGDWIKTENFCISNRRIAHHLQCNINNLFGVIKWNPFS